jgi:hypothetical protein
VRGPISQKALKLQGAVYGTRLPGLYENKAAFRFSAPPLEIVHVPGGANIWNLNIHTSDVRSLRFLSSFSMLRNWSRSGPLELEVWLQGHRAFGGTVSARRETGTDLHTGLLSSILESLIQVAGEEESGRIEICIDHINAALADLIHFSKFISAGPFALSFPVNDEIPQSVTSVLYFQRVKVDCWTFGCLVLREVLKDCIDDDHRFLFAGAPVLLECHTWSAEIEGHDDPIVTAYERALLRLEKDETTLAVGDAFAYVRAKSVCEFPPSGESGGMSVRPA